MIRHLALLHLVALLPGLAPARVLHRAGLERLARGDAACAERLFERAALAYRRELDVERLARVRVHQLIARHTRGGSAEGAETLALEIERRLYRLPRIETLKPPFEEVDARRLLAQWMPAARVPQPAAA